MLQKTYSIYSDDLHDVQLIVEAGKNHIACWCKKENENSILAFEFFLCDAYHAENFEQLIDQAKLHSRLLTMPVLNIHFYWNNTEALCLPNENTDADFLEANFNLIFGESNKSKVFFTNTEHCLVAWRVEDKLWQAAQKCFGEAVYSHQFAALLSALHPVATCLYLLFYPHYFAVVAFKESKLQFIQNVNYNTPEDVLYFVLNVCKQYGIENKTGILCGGFVEEKSKLYEMLYQYLEGLELIKPDETKLGADEFKQYAPHYFVPYINYPV